MIDFRYLLTTIVAVFLALAIGLLIGSGLLADALKEDLERQVEGVVDRNNELRDRILDQQGLIDALETFSLEIEPRLAGNELSGDQIVLVRFEGTEARLVERLIDSIEVADGTIATTITIRDRMSMSDSSAVEDLLGELDVAFAQGEEDPAVIVGREMGARAASDASGRTQEPSFGSVQDELVDHEFIDIEARGAVPIPAGAEFLVVAGGEGEPPYDLGPFSEAFLSALGQGPPVVAAEGWASEWGFVSNLRESDVRDDVATVDHGDTVPGSLSAIVELERLPSDRPGHYGFNEGADAIAPSALFGG